MSSSNAPRGFDRELGPGGLETRTLPTSASNVRAKGDKGSRKLVGYGSVFDSRYTVGGLFEDWDEEVAPGAFADAIKPGRDVRSMRNHSVDFLLGRTTSGSLRLDEDGHGLRYEIDVNDDDPAAVGTHAQVKRGDIDGSSIWFRIAKQEWTLPSKANGLKRPLRRILKVDPLFEVGPVVFPASPATAVDARTGRVLDAVLRSAGVTSARERAALAEELLADPDRAAAELRSLFARSPGLRDAACSLDGGSRSTMTDRERRIRHARTFARMHGLDEGGLPR